MKLKVLAAVAVLGFAVASASACEPKCGKKAEAQKVAAKDKGGCSHAKAAEAKKVADKGGCSKSKAQTVAGKGGCSKSKAQTVAGKGGCSKSKAQTVAGKGGCSKKCGMSAKTVADKGGCSKSKAQTVAGKGGCSKSKAQTVAGKGGCSKKCGMSAKTVAGKGGCPVSAKVDAVLASMPEVTYMVGDQATCCPKAANYMAEKTKEPMMYVVGDNKFKSEGEAMAKLASHMATEVSNMQSVQYSVGEDCSRCPMTAKSMAKKSGKKMMYRVAGWDFADKAAADKASKAAIDAAKTVMMSYKTEDGKSFCCSTMAGSHAKKVGKKMSYVVGEEATGCETHAKILLSQAKARAMVEAVGKVAL